MRKPLVIALACALAAPAAAHATFPGGTGKLAIDVRGSYSDEVGQARYRAITTVKADSKGDKFVWGDLPQIDRDGKKTLDEGKLAHSYGEMECYTCHTSAGWDSGRGAGGRYDLPSSPILATGSVQPGGSNHHPARWCDSEARREAARSGARTRGARADAKRP